MALKTWLWNLGATGVVVAAGGGCTSVVVFPEDEVGHGETDTDDPWDPTPGSGYDDDDGPDDEPYGATPGGYYDTDDYYYDTDYYNDTDYYSDPDCKSDEDCELGTCVDAGQPWSYCEPLPIPDVCPDEPAVAITWVRQGEQAGVAAGMPESGRVVLLEADGVPVSVAATEPDAVPEPLPVTVLDGESVTGAAGADLDGDGDTDIVLSVQDDTRLRVVPLLSDGAGAHTEGTPLEFEARGEPAELRRFADGSVQLLARLDSGLLFAADGLGDGSFAAGEPSAWATDPIGGFALGLLDVGDSEDLAVTTLGPNEGESSIAALIDGGEIPVGVPGAASRSIHVDAFDRWIVTVDVGQGQTRVEAVFMEVAAKPQPLLMLDRDSPVLASTVADLDGDGRSDLAQLREDGSLRVVFQVSSAQACTQELMLESEGLGTLHRAGTGTEAGIVVSGPAGVIAVGPAQEAGK